jgi:UDP-N-acetylmuramoylalanine-D-glutamate ligase
MRRSSKRQRATTCWPTERESAVLDRTGALLVGFGGSSGKSVTLALTADMLRSAGFRVTVGLEAALEQPDRLGPSDRVLVELPPEPPAVRPGPLDVLVLSSLCGDELPAGRALPPVVATLHDAVSRARCAAVINADDARLLALASASRTPVVTASLNGYRSTARLVDGHVVVTTPAADVRLVAAKATSYSYGVLLADMVVATAAATALSVGPDPIRSVLVKQRPLPGRAEVLGAGRCVRWVDDSFGTTPGRAAAAVLGERGPLAVLAGGHYGGQSLARWARSVSYQAAYALLFGTAAAPMSEALCTAGFADRIVRCADLQDAVSIVTRLTERGDTVIFSPGAAPEAVASAPSFRDLAPVATPRSEAA